MTPENPKLPLTCTRCSHQWSIELPEPEFSNNYKSSTVTVAHERPVRCPNNKCRAPYQLIIQAAQLVMNCVPLPDEMALKLEGTSIIKPRFNLITGVQ